MHSRLFSMHAQARRHAPRRRWASGRRGRPRGRGRLPCRRQARQSARAHCGCGSRESWPRRSLRSHAYDGASTPLVHAHLLSRKSGLASELVIRGPQPAAASSRPPDHGKHGGMHSAPELHMLGGCSAGSRDRGTLAAERSTGPSRGVPGWRCSERPAATRYTAPPMRTRRAGRALPRTPPRSTPAPLELRRVGMTARRRAEVDSCGACTARAAGCRPGVRRGVASVAACAPSPCVAPSHLGVSKRCSLQPRSLASPAHAQAHQRSLAAAQGRTSKASAHLCAAPGQAGAPGHCCDAGPLQLQPARSALVQQHLHRMAPVSEHGKGMGRHKKAQYAKGCALGDRWRRAGQSSGPGRALRRREGRCFSRPCLPRGPASCCPAVPPTLARCGFQRHDRPSPCRPRRSHCHVRAPCSRRVARWLQRGPVCGWVRRAQPPGGQTAQASPALQVHARGPACLPRAWRGQAAGAAGWASAARTLPAAAAAAGCQVQQ